MPYHIETTVSIRHTFAGAVLLGAADLSTVGGVAEIRFV